MYTYCVCHLIVDCHHHHRRLWSLRASRGLMAVFPKEDSASVGVYPLSLSEGSERSSLPSESARGSRRKQLFSERPSGSFTSGGLMNVLREASPLAAFRRKRTCFRPSASSRRKGVLRFIREASPLAGWRLSERRSLPSASFGFLKEA